MITTLYIMGSGIKSNVVKEVASDLGYQHIYQVDLNGDYNSKLSTLFSDLDLSSDFYLHIALGHNFLRYSIYSFLLKRRLHNHLISIVHPSSSLSPSCEVDIGSYIGPGVFLGPSVRIGTCNLLCTGSIIEHDCRLCDFCSSGPGVVLSGSVKVDLCTFLGASSSYRQGIRIGAHTVIGLNSTVISDIPSYVIAFGSPAIPIKPRSFSTPYL